MVSMRFSLAGALNCDSCYLDFRGNTIWAFPAKAAYGRTPSQTRNKLLLKATFSGIPVAIAGRGAPEGLC